MSAQVTASTGAAQDLDRLGRLWQSLRRALQDIDRTIKSVSDDRQLTLAHWLVLLRLHHESPMAQCDLRRQTSLDSGFLTRVLDDLDDRHLVKRARGTEDRRQMHLKITLDGRKTVGSMLTAAERLRLPESLTAPNLDLQAIASVLTRAPQS